MVQVNLGSGYKGKIYKQRSSPSGGLAHLGCHKDVVWGSIILNDGIYKCDVCKQTWSKDLVDVMFMFNMTEYIIPDKGKARYHSDIGWVIEDET